MSKRFSLVLTAALLFVGSQAFFSCDVNDDESGGTTLEGYWKSLSYGDGFEISGSTYKQYDDSAKTVSFAGTIVNSPDLGMSSGMITIKITNSGTWGMTNAAYFVIRWENFTATTVKAGAAGIWGGTNNSGMSTQTAAEAEYTVANGYFTGLSDYVRQ